MKDDCDGFAMVWNKMLHSTIWKEPPYVRVVFLTFLLLKNKDGVVKSSRWGIGHAANVTDEECEKALKVLMSPDEGSTTKTDEGRRINEIPGGFFVVNHEYYRFSTDEKREYWKKQKAEQRAREAVEAAAKQAKKPVKKTILDGELDHERSLNNGESQEKQDAIITANLPAKCRGDVQIGPED